MSKSASEEILLAAEKNARIAWGGRAVFQNTAVGQTYYDQINI